MNGKTAATKVRAESALAEMDGGVPAGIVGGGKVIVLQRLKDDTVEIPIVGVTPLIPHRWSEKAKLQMRDKQTGAGVVKAGKMREPKNPEQEAEDSLYKFPDGGLGMPAVAFKAAMVEACRFFPSIAMTDAKRILFVQGEGPEQLVPITAERHFREDTPRIANGVADLRYRYGLTPWKATIVISFPQGMISRESVAALLDAAGRNGVGDWRPGSPKSNSGTYGQFRVHLGE